MKHNRNKSKKFILKMKGKKIIAWLNINFMSFS